MNVRQYSIVMGIGTAFCWVGWLVTILGTPPAQASALELVFFYATLFLALVGTGSISGLSVRRRLRLGDELLIRQVKNSLRQSVLGAATVVALLLLSAGKLLTWWNAPLLIVLVACVEALLFSRRKFSNTLYGP